ncbi:MULTISPECIES: cryptochrome/photolyase family protein [unclassified Roseitalea]|uniref:cryptochrome/photolyase family protein n=1 Tax=unclassified Roseitalea TaxID=2639107 RepID=UPI00273D3D8A|nr:MULTISPECIES: cryptochrome/photolyase family protein [unclassified Roseitalea]
MARALRFILGDQLSRDIATLRDADRDGDIVLMCEVDDEATYVRHHKKKIAFIFAAMRHYADDLRNDGFEVDYRQLDDPDHRVSSFTQALRQAVERHGPDRVVVTEPGEWRVLQMMKDWQRELDVDVEIRTDDRFIATRDDFAAWAKGRKSLRMETFYRRMRRRTGFLMEGGEPAGSRWNFDRDNRAPPADGLSFPDRPHWSVDETTQQVLDLVAARFGDHFGDLEPFAYPVTRRQATRYLNWFVTHALADFGAYQDAMMSDEALMYHSHLSALLNVGLLDPRECCDKAEAAWRAGAAPLNSVEGFIRQIIGWREFVRGIYWLNMPGYGEANALAATRELPQWFWTGQTHMKCLRQAIGQTRQNAYAHHIQRLMVIGNFALLAGLDPRQVQEWFLIVYHDAYEWVEMPNVVGMALFADGGLFATKPYASSGAYIDRMSDYCGGCRYSVNRKAGPKACPFNYLYWNFLIENRQRFAGNRRMAMMYGTLDRMKDERKDAIRADSARFFKRIEEA